MAVLPAHHPAPPARPGQGARLHVQDRDGARVLPAARDGRRRHRARRPARPARPALLRHEGPDAPVRVPLHALDVRERARVGRRTPTTTRTRTASSSRTSSSPTPSRRPTGRSSSATWCTPWPRSEGLLATFMAKPFGHLTGNGGHFHMSLWDECGERDLFDDPSDPNGLGLSTLGYHFLGGLKKHAKAYIAVTAPTVNSYKRLTTTTGTPTSGATWSPIFVTHGAQQPHADAALPGRPRRGPHGRRELQPVPGRRSDPGGRPGRDRARRRSRPDQRRQPVHAQRPGAQAAQDRAPAGEPARRDAQSREGQGAPRRPRQHRHRGLRRLLREDEAGRMDRPTTSRSRRGRSRTT